MPEQMHERRSVEADLHFPRANSTPRFEQLPIGEQGHRTSREARHGNTPIDLPPVIQRTPDCAQQNDPDHVKQETRSACLKTSECCEVLDWLLFQAFSPMIHHQSRQKPLLFARISRGDLTPAQIRRLQLGLEPTNFPQGRVLRNKCMTELAYQKVMDTDDRECIGGGSFGNRLWETSLFV